MWYSKSTAFFYLLQYKQNELLLDKNKVVYKKTIL